MTRTTSLWWLPLVFLVAGATASQAEYPPEALSAVEQARWQGYSGREAGQELLAFRERRDPAAFATRFVLFLDQGRTTREVLDLVNVIGLPLFDEEVEAISDVYLETPDRIHHRNPVEFGYHLEVHGTPGTRVSIVFLSNKERAVYRKKFIDRQVLSPEEDEIYGNLEGRMCVWAAKRKIHLGGPRLTYERVRPILAEPSPWD